jgi:hypothetical protein
MKKKERISLSPLTLLAFSVFALGTIMLQVQPARAAYADSSAPPCLAFKGPFTLYFPSVLGGVGVPPTPTPVIHVDLNNIGSEDGSSAHPFNTIQEGINNASDGNKVLVHPAPIWKMLQSLVRTSP